MKKLIILQTAAPHYRKGIYSYLNLELGDYFKLYSGKSYFEKSITTDKTISFIKPVKNFYFFNRRLLFQMGMWHQVFKKNTMVLEMNPRIISNWLILIIRRLLLKKTVLWGHAWPRNGKKSKTDLVRHFMRLLGNEIIVYTQTQANELKQKMPKKKITAAPNALYLKKNMLYNEDNRLITNLIYVGRLSKAKKAFFLVKAFHEALSEIPNTCHLIIVGEGEEKIDIENYIIKNNLKERISLKGHISDLKTLEKLYATSLFSISPGYVGLSITQSFSFGTPMIISREENHSPEIEAALKGVNALFFETNSKASFKETLKCAFQQKLSWINKRQEICQFCKNTYSTEAMAKTFLNVIK
ncbi:glycosyltransferase [uncultured Winogradskyella sp.]|uniref:glycosyltransferase n=1 Tax=uncultured Winogradskyella sp. TaxID=395353 RepID=UPI00262B420A|nr:glycosyltransferase [uncultured Winogradskyella sp.]